MWVAGGFPSHKTHFLSALATEYFMTRLCRVAQGSGLQVFSHTHTHTFAHTHTHTHTCAHTHPRMYTHTHKHTHTYLHTHKQIDPGGCVIGLRGNVVKLPLSDIKTGL